MLDIINTGFVKMPNDVVRKTNNRVLHTFCHLIGVLALVVCMFGKVDGYLSKSFCLGMLLEAKGREMDTGSENLGLGQNTDTSNSINLHFHIWITVGVSKVGQMRTPSSILSIALDNNGVFV